MNLPKKREKARAAAKTTEHAPNRWDRYWFGSVAAIRPYLLVKAVLFLVAADLWMVRLRSGWRYGVDEFNVAHFALLDALQPAPTAGLHNGLVLLVGILAIVCAITGAGLCARVTLALAYTYTWAQSMLDNYQHHYFLSLVLLAFIFFPSLPGRHLYPAEPSQTGDASNPEVQRVSSWAYVLLAANVAVVYGFAALAKIEEESWKLFRHFLEKRKEIRDALEAWFTGVGIAAEWFWALTVWSIIAAEIFLGVLYLLAAKQDESRSRWLRIAAWCGIVLALIFHGLGNEVLLSLSIGWFSYYMIALAFIYFLPESILRGFGRFATWPSRQLAQIWRRFCATHAAASPRSRITAIGSLLTAVVAAGIGFTLDLPGASTAGLIIAIFLAIFSVLAVRLRRFEEAERYILATGVATILMWSSVTLSVVRFEYYRMLTEYNEYQGNLEAAKQFSAKARLYASKHKQ